MKWKIPNFKIYWDEDDTEHVQNVIKRGMFWANGPEILQFEEKIKEYVESQYALCFANGTAALHAILLAYEIGKGDEVIVPSFTFIATANAPLFVGARPVFAEIEGTNFGLDPADVSEKITNKTKAIMPIHYGGCPCKIRELKEIAKDNNLLLIEDAAEAFGAKIGKQNVGNFGDSAVLSFCQNKIISTGEGGAIVTNSRQIYEKLKLIRSHGRVESQDYFNSCDMMEYNQLGYNFRISSINAALGISQMKKIDKIIQMRRNSSKYLTEKLASIPNVKCQKLPSDFYHVYQMFTILVDQSVRDSLMKYLVEKGIMVKVNFYPIHLTKFYSETFGYHRGNLPITEDISDKVLSLPMYPDISKDDLDFIVEEIHNYFRCLYE
jgi:perosamine synthetase